MSIELRILSGARAGHTESFDKSVVAIGRHPLNDLRFDAQKDLDVSTRHAEIRCAVEGKYLLYDLQSTNGTFVNDQRLAGPRELRTGDTVRFGANGPSVGVRVQGQDAPTNVAPAWMAPTHPGPPRPATTERVAVAVRQQTRGIKMMLAATVVVFGAAAGGVFWVASRSAARRDAQIQELLAQNDKASKEFQVRLQQVGD